MSVDLLKKRLTNIGEFCAHHFETHPSIKPMYHVFTADGQESIFGVPEAYLNHRDALAGTLRKLFDMTDVVCYVSAIEGWYLRPKNNITAAEIEKMDSIANHPDRVECVMLMGESEVGSMIAIRPITKDRKLGPMEIVVQPGDGMQGEGRFVSLLPQRGTKQ